MGQQISGVNLFGTMPAWTSLGVTLGLIAGGVLYSLSRTRDSSAIAGETTCR